MNLTVEQYYSKQANEDFMSVSQFKDFISCEARAMAKLEGWEEPNRDAFLVGNYVHSAFDGTLEQFREKHPEIYSSRGASKGELKSEYKLADTMIEKVKGDSLCMNMLEGKHEQIVLGNLFGVSWKARIDVVNVEEGRIVDLKTVKNIRERIWNIQTSRYESFVEAYGYHLQMAVYQEIEWRDRKGYEKLEPFIVAVSKEDVPDLQVICFDDNTIKQQLEFVEQKLPRIMEVKKYKTLARRCEKCRFCRETKRAEIIHYMNLLEE
jgi:hypothetical protein